MLQWIVGKVLAQSDNILAHFPALCLYHYAVWTGFEDGSEVGNISTSLQRKSVL